MRVGHHILDPPRAVDVRSAIASCDSGGWPVDVGQGVCRIGCRSLCDVSRRTEVLRLTASQRARWAHGARQGTGSELSLRSLRGGVIACPIIWNLEGKSLIYCAVSARPCACDRELGRSFELA